MQIVVKLSVAFLRTAEKSAPTLVSTKIDTMVSTYAHPKENNIFVVVARVIGLGLWYSRYRLLTSRKPTKVASGSVCLFPLTLIF